MNQLMTARQQAQQAQRAPHQQQVLLPLRVQHQQLAQQAQHQQPVLLQLQAQQSSQQLVLHQQPVQLPQQVRLVQLLAQKDKLVPMY